VLAACREGDYGFLFASPSLLGAPDERVFTPLLVIARDQNWEYAYVARLLESLGLARVQSHPGFRLTVETLGNFQVKRGSEVIPPNGWRREKSRQLFQLLISYRPRLTATRFASISGPKPTLPPRSAISKSR
jgi:hypothetical protein